MPIFFSCDTLTPVIEIDCLQNQNQNGFAKRIRKSETEKSLAWSNRQLFTVTWRRHDSFTDRTGIRLDEKNQCFDARDGILRINGRVQNCLRAEFRRVKM